MKTQIDHLADSVFVAVKGFLTAELDRRLAALPVPKDGAPGKDADLTAVETEIAEIEKGLADVRSIAVSPEHVETMIKSAIESLPKPKDGDPGKDGRDGVDGKDGAPGVDGKTGFDGLPGQDGVDGKDGKDGMDGEPGRDGLRVDVLDSIDEETSYQRGTHACYRGGVIRAKRRTDPLMVQPDLDKAGWQVVLDGIDETIPEISADSRVVTLSIKRTSGVVTKRGFAVPTMIYRGIWKEGEYQLGDVTTYGGQLWHCQQETKTQPGVSPDWKLCVRKGMDGKDAGERKQPQVVALK